MPLIQLSELDILIFFYLQECGFLHSAYTFSQETNLNGFFLDKKNIPPGILISLYQRGIIYSQLETNSFLSFRNNSRSSIENLIFDKPDFLNNSYFCPTNKIFEKNINGFCHTYSIYVFLWHSRQFSLFFGTRDSKIFKWKFNLLKKSRNIKKISSQIFFSEKISKKIDVIAMDMNLNGTIIASGLLNGKIILMAETGKVIKIFKIPEDSLLEIKWSENSRNLILGNCIGSIFIWSSWYDQFLLKFSFYKISIKSMKWINNNNFLNCSKEKILSSSNIKTKKIQMSQIHSLKINDIAISHNKNVAAACSDDKIISILNIKNGLYFQNFLIGHEKEVCSISWKPSKFKKYKEKKKINKIIFSCSLDFCLRIWDIDKQVTLHIILQKGPLLSLSWDGFGKELIMSIVGGEIIILNKIKKKSKMFMLKNFNIFDLNSHSMLNKNAALSIKTIFTF